MATVRTSKRPDGTYHYLVQTYRRGGAILTEEEYLGVDVPANLEARKLQIERKVWEKTWFLDFEQIRQGYLARSRLAKSVSEKDSEDFVIEFTYDTNRIEGSTLTFDETRELLEQGVSPPGRPMRDVVETLRHAQLVRRLTEKPEPVDLPHLLAWHKFLFAETKPDIAGRVRDVQVGIRGSRHSPPMPIEVRPMLLELLRWTRRSAPTIHPVERAGTFHFRFENIHPFGDGNGRLGRLAMNLLLRKAGYPMLNIRYPKRRGYYHALERSSVTDDPRRFLLWFFRRYVRDSKLYIPRASSSRNSP
ncbi:MAG: Fic family protein [Thermoplasmata archaeon]|nr:Fic family protein [Thermoplasmata archaeon]